MGNERLLALVSHGVGLVSTLATVALFVLPSFASGVARWWALAPLLAFIIGALLKDEYDRISAPCLTAELVREENDSGNYRYTFLEIRNCGPVTVEGVECELPSDARGWDLHTNGLEYPVSELEPDARTRFLLIMSMGRSAQARVTLRGFVDGKPYERTRLLNA
jgi:phosphate/sulfate permease